jgi:LppP/LprE lipoprotein
VFFWDNDRFLGWDSAYESIEIQSLYSPAEGTIAVEHTHYASTDPMCCPSLPPVVVA